MEKLNINYRRFKIQDTEISYIILQLVWSLFHAENKLNGTYSYAFPGKLWQFDDIKLFDLTEETLWSDYVT